MRALALQSGCFSNAAYLHVGTAVRIAFSLGLHREKDPPNSSYMQKEYNRRLWWALYVLDYDIASRFGNPCAISQDITVNQRQFPTEEVRSFGKSYYSQLLTPIDCWSRDVHSSGVLDRAVYSD